MKKISLLLISLLITLVSWSGETEYSELSDYQLREIMLNSNSDMSMSMDMSYSYNSNNNDDLKILFYIAGVAAFINGVYFIGHAFDSTPPTTWNKKTNQWDSSLHSVPWGINVSAGIGCVSIITYHFTSK